MACYWGNYCTTAAAAFAPTVTYYVQQPQYVNCAAAAAPCCYYYPQQQQPAVTYVSSCAYARPVQQVVNSRCQAACRRTCPPARSVVMSSQPVVTCQSACRHTCLPAHPPVYSSGGCYGGQERHVYYQPEPTVVRNVELNFYDTQTVVRENNNHYTHQRTVVTNVNRNHWHTQRIVTNENNYNTYVTNNVIRVNDIHHQRVENVEGEKRVFNDYQQTQSVEPANCVVADSPLSSSCESSN